jgi:hypothetical protein
MGIKYKTSPEIDIEKSNRLNPILIFEWIIRVLRGSNIGKYWGVLRTRPEIVIIKPKNIEKIAKSR